MYDVVDSAGSAGMWECNWVWGKSRRFFYLFCLVDPPFGSPIPISEELESLWKGGVVLSPGGAEKVPNPPGWHLVFPTVRVESRERM